MLAYKESKQKDGSSFLLLSVGAHQFYINKKEEFREENMRSTGWMYTPPHSKAQSWDHSDEVGTPPPKKKLNKIK